MDKLKFHRHQLLVPLTLMVFFLFFFLIYEDIKKRTIDEFTNEQLILARTASQGITSFFEDIKSNLDFLARLNTIIEFNDNGKALMEEFFETHKNQLAAITRVDAKGIILHTYPFNQSAIGDDISLQAHVQKVITTRQPVISDVFTSVQGYLAIAMHVPVFDSTTFVGSLALLIPINKLGEHYLGNIKIRGTGSAWLMSENGIELFCPIDGHWGKHFIENTQNEVIAANLLEKIKINQSGTAQSIHQGIIENERTKYDKNYITFYKVAIENTFWTILISCQEKDIHSSFTRLRNRLILVFSVLFIFIGYYFYSLSKVRNVLKEEQKRKNAEKTLRESEEKFKTFFNESPIGIELFKADGTFVDANPASLKMFGVSGVAAIKNFNLFDGTTMDPNKKKKLRNGESVYYQSIFDFEKVKDLHQYETGRSGKAYFDYIITPLMNTGNKSIDGYLLLVQDISERKRAEEEILLLAHSVRSVNECVSITDMENKILFVNQSFLKTYGFDEDELLGKHLEILRSPNNPPELVAEILPATIKGNWKGELLNKKKDGTEFPIYLSTTIVKDRDNNTIGLIGVASDITERRRNEKELIQAKEKAEESDRLKSAFLANMSHEIRTPMNGILGFSGLLKEPGLTGDEQQKYIQIIEKSGARMLNTINDIIDISKIEAGLMKISISEVNVNGILEYLLSFFKPEADTKGIQISVFKSLTDPDSVVLTDKVKLNSVLTNLVKNAIIYSQAGIIEFGYEIIPPQYLDENNVTSENQAQLKFYVKDYGIGISKIRQQAIFERFVQADIDNKHAQQGSGLGLAISKAYVEMLGGKIWVESETGKGSTFYFTLPYNADAGEKRETKQAFNAFGDRNKNRKLNIVIAEDDPASAIFLKIATESITNKVYVAKNGIETVNVCRETTDIDLVLMDIQMPGMNGFEAIRQIRIFNRNVIIIAQTAYALAGDRENAIEAGCNDYITKPIKVNELIELIHQYFK